MAAIPIRLDGLLAKVETTYLTDSVPVVGTDGVRLSERLWPTIRVSNAWENTRDDVHNQSILPVAPALPRGRMCELDIPWEVRGAGADVVPEADPLFRASGCSVTDGLLMFDYTQASNLHEGCTIYAYGGGMLFRVVGCRGGFRWQMQAGQVAVIRFLMRGLLVTDPVASAATAVTYDSTEPVAGVNVAMTVGAWTPDWFTAELNQGVDAQRLDSGNATDGIAEFDYGEAKPMFTMSARVPRTAGGIWDSGTYDPHVDAKTNTGRAIAATWGSAQFNRLKITSTTGYVRAPAHVANNQFAAWDLRYLLTAWNLRFD